MFEHWLGTAGGIQERARALAGEDATRRQAAARLLVAAGMLGRHGVAADDPRFDEVLVAAAISLNGQAAALADKGFGGLRKEAHALLQAGWSLHQELAIVLPSPRPVPYGIDTDDGRGCGASATLLPPLLSDRELRAWATAHVAYSVSFRHEMYGGMPAVRIFLRSGRDDPAHGYHAALQRLCAGRVPELTWSYEHANRPDEPGAYVVRTRAVNLRLRLEAWIDAADSSAPQLEERRWARHVVAVLRRTPDHPQALRLLTALLPTVPTAPTAINWMSIVWHARRDYPLLCKDPSDAAFAGARERTLRFLNSLALMDLVETPDDTPAPPEVCEAARELLEAETELPAIARGDRVSFPLQSAPGLPYRNWPPPWSRFVQAVKNDPARRGAVFAWREVLDRDPECPAMSVAAQRLARSVLFAAGATPVA